MRNITLTIPNDDTTALRHFGKALIEIASEKEGRPLAISDETLQQALPRMMDAPEVDTTAQQVESLAKNTVDREVHFDDPVPQASDTTDSTGTPWDERVHSASKALNADGTWRLRRKPKDMDEEQWAAFVETVKGELHTQTPVMTDEEVKALEPAEIGEPTWEEVDELIKASNKMLEPPVTPPGDDFHTDAGVVTEQTVAGIPPIPVPPPVVVAPPVPEFDDGVPFPPSGTVSPALERMADHSAWDFPRLMTFLTERHGKIDVATVNTLLAQDGMSSVQELNAHPDKIGPFVARVKAHLGE